MKHFVVNPAVSLSLEPQKGEICISAYPTSGIPVKFILYHLLTDTTVTKRLFAFNPETPALDAMATPIFLLIYTNRYRKMWI